MADPISILMGLAQYAPAVIKWATTTGSDKAEEVAGKVIDVAKTLLRDVLGSDPFRQEQIY